MPGMAASPLIFEHIKLPATAYTMHMLDWIIPHKNESLLSYSTRLLEQVAHETPVLIGVSFGGIIVQAMASLIPTKQVIIISSVKSHHEFPRRMQLARKTGLHKLLPTSLMSHFEELAKYGTTMAPKKIELYKRYLNINDPMYLDWALDTIVNWTQEKPQQDVIHIHGDKDPVFPIKYIDNCTVVPGGTHIMIVNRFKWFNENLPIILS